MTENKDLSLDEMLNLTNKIESWTYHQEQHSFFSYTSEQYTGQINNIVIEIGQRRATPWGGWIRYIKASYGNLQIGNFPRRLEHDDRLNHLFAHSLPEKIRQQGIIKAREIK